MESQDSNPAELQLGEELPVDEQEMEEMAELEDGDMEPDTETRKQVLVVDTGGIVKVSHFWIL